jgi:Plasmid encoded RepA protein
VHTTIEPDPTDPLAFDRAVKLYADLGLSASRTIGQLLRAGHSPARVRAHFTDAPEEWFCIGSESYTTRHLVSALSTSQAIPVLPRPDSRSPLRRIPDTLPAVRAQELTTDTNALCDQDGISFQYVPLIQCSFPHTDPGRESSFTRRNGWLELTLSTARPETGLPYGVPARLLTIYCASEAVRRQSPEIYLGRSVHEFLRRLDIPVSRGERGSLRTYANQLLRLIHCAVSIDENIRDASGRSGLHIRQTLFVEEARLWWDEASGVGQGSSLVLSPALYESIVGRSAPLSTDAIRQLRKSPMDLDVYAWLVHRLFTLSRPSQITWAQLSGQFGHTYGALRYFRRFFGESLQRVLRVYPDARLKCTDQGVLLLPSRPHVVPRSVR